MLLFSVLKTHAIMEKHHILWPPLQLLIKLLYLQLNAMKASIKHCSHTHTSRQQYYMAGYSLA